MALTIYGSAQSRTLRVLWMATELGLEFTHVPLAYDDPALKSAEFLAISPAGAVPAIVDDGFALAESLAVNLYLAKKYGGRGRLALYPSNPRNEAETWRWSLWAQGHLEPFIQRDALLTDMRTALGDHAKTMAARALGILDRALSTRPWLVGERFTVADLNVACVLSPSRTAHLDLEATPAVRDWIAACRRWPAFIATRARYAVKPAD